MMPEKGLLSRDEGKQEAKKYGSILVIEDDDYLRDYLAELLELSGFNVILAEDGNHGMSKFKQHMPNLVLTDVVMPGRDGISLTVQFKKLHPDVRVIAMSGRWMSDSDVDCSNAAVLLGVDRILSKPFSARNLKDAILEIVQLESA
ncbi:MAG: response regulator [Gammaproteobacteria bacterium]|nr:response regulator [Gammaproteobacteria bacterium]